MRAAVGREQKEESELWSGKTEGVRLEGALHHPLGAAGIRKKLFARSRRLLRLRGGPPSGAWRGISVCGEVFFVRRQLILGFRKVGGEGETDLSEALL